MDDEKDKVNEENNLEEGLDLNDHDLFSEEIATEIIENDSEIAIDEDSEIQITNNVYGWIAIALSILSFFIMPYVFAGASIILGFVARTRDTVILGSTAIAIGIISIIIRFLIL